MKRAYNSIDELHSPIDWRRLIVLSLVPFSSHYFRSSVSIAAICLLERGFFTIQGYSVLQASSYLPDVLLPMAFGIIFDNIRGDTMTMLRLSIIFQLISVGGIFLFAAALWADSYDLTFIAFIVFGMGSICGNTCQRYCIAYEFNENIEISMLTYITIGNLAKVVAKLLASIIALREIVLSQVFFGALSFTLSVLSLFMARQVSDDSHATKQNSNFTAEDASENHFTAKFWVYVVIHGLYLVIFHTFTNFLPMLIKFGGDATLLEVGFYSSLSSIASIVVCVSTSYFINHHHEQARHIEITCALMAAVTIICLALLVQPLNGKTSTIVIVLVLLSIAQSIIGNLTLVIITTIVPKKKLGFGIGLVESLDSCLAIVCSFFFGLIASETGDFVDSLWLLVVLSSAGLLLIAAAKAIN